jgi:hypothetical protein
MRPLPATLAMALALGGCATLHNDGVDGAISKTGQGFGSLLEGMGSELKTRVWRRSEPTDPVSVPAAHSAPALRP